MNDQRKTRGWLGRSAVLAGGSCVLLGAALAYGAADDKTSPEKSSPAAAAKIDGRELFNREWLPADPRSHGGDGLGPVFNDSSCVACHNQGGAGGAGPASKNVDIISAFQNQMNFTNEGSFGGPGPTLPEQLFHSLFGDLGGTKPAAAQVSAEEQAKLQAAQAKQAEELAKAELSALHPGFLAARSVVLHHFGTDGAYEKWRSRMFGMGNGMVQQFGVDGVDLVDAGDVDIGIATANQAVAVQVSESTAERQAVQQQMDAQQDRQAAQMQTRLRGAMNQGATQVGNFAIVHSQRNPIALFGDGAMDAIPDKVLEDRAAQKFEGFPEISGRVARLKDGKLGRFGWKAQKATLEDFTLTACAVELGLDVPGQSQAGVPQKPDYKAPGQDLSKGECEALEQYLRDLPSPKQRGLSSKQEADYIKAGEQHFAKIGCAACHAPKLGEVVGLYSDLLLHDMGNDLGDSGSYGVFVPNSSDEEPLSVLPNLAVQEQRPEPTAEELAKTIGALRQEWRTPPLWGVRDSAPYLHDGRADSLEQAIALHGGEGELAAQRFYALKPEERMQLIAFLKSLVAPDPQLAAN